MIKSVHNRLKMWKAPFVSKIVPAGNEKNNFLSSGLEIFVSHLWMHMHCWLKQVNLMNWSANRRFFTLLEELSISMQQKLFLNCGCQSLGFQWTNWNHPSLSDKKTTKFLKNFIALHKSSIITKNRYHKNRFKYQIDIDNQN